MNKKRLLLIATIFITIIATLVINAQGSPAPTSTSSSSPTSTSSPSPSPTTTNCYGEAEETFTITKRKNFGEEDNEKKITQNIKEALKELNNNQDIKDFKDCKRPPTFSCPSNCQVELLSDPIIQIFPPLPPDNPKYNAKFAYTGSITKTFSWVEVLKLGILNIINTDAAVDAVMPSLMKEIQRVINQIIASVSCPAGYARALTIQINNVETKTNYVWGVPVSITYTVHYTVYVFCVKTTDNPTYVDMTLKLKLIKQCIPKTQ